MWDARAKVFDGNSLHRGYNPAMKNKYTDTSKGRQLPESLID